MTNEAVQKKRIWGWYFFDWASQPYNTILLTFIFSPYFAELVGDGGKAQTMWTFGQTISGLVIAFLSPILGAVADAGGKRRRWIFLFSALYFLGSYGLWWTAPESFNPVWTIVIFSVGLIGMEFATNFTNSYLPELGPKEKLGRISGNGWAFGYLGGFFALLITLLLLAERSDTGKTFLGLPPLFGLLDPTTREGTRSVGPFVALWYALFMIPFFLWVRENRSPKVTKGAVPTALRELGATIRSLPKKPSLFAYLTSSMFYRDALNAIYGVGGVYAYGVLGWGAVDSGIFGIVAIVTGVIFTWLGGRADAKFGAKRVVVVLVFVMMIVVAAIATTSRDSVLGFAVAPDSSAPDITFYVIGAIIGAVGGALQSASRTLMVYQCEPGRISEGFGLYALTGKASSFLAPWLIGMATLLSGGNQQIGITPLIGLFFIGLVLMIWVKPDGDLPR